MKTIEIREKLLEKIRGVCICIPLNFVKLFLSFLKFSLIFMSMDIR